MRKQKLWKSMLAVLTCTTLVLSGTLVYAEEQEENGSEFVIEDGVLVKYQGNAEEVIVPEGVTRIGNMVFRGYSSLTSIDLPDSVSSIGNWAFQGCSSLTSIDLPDNVSSIGSEVFSGCSSLTSINVSPQNSEYASYDGCLYNKDFTELIICPAKKNEVELMDNLITIRSSAFSSCSSLTSIKLPDSVSSIGSSAFQGCSSLTSIDLPDSMSSIGSSAFSGCSSLTSIELPEGVSSISSSVFSGCSSLTSIKLPEGVSSIETWAFKGCSSLTSIDLPDSVSAIGFDVVVGVASSMGYIFEDCSSLTSINVSPQNSKYASYDGCLYNKDFTELISCPGGKNEVKLMDNLITIRRYAFSGCSSLTSIELPDSVSSIEYLAFSGCSSLTSIELPDSVSSIGSSAFLDCSSLTSIKLPDSVSSIESSAFQGCSSLTSIELPDSVSSIGSFAFRDCSNLTSIELPDSVSSIGSSAFSGCSSLTSINVAQQSSEYASYDGCLYNKDFTELIYCPAGKHEVKLMDNLITIGEAAFSGCSSLTSIELSDSVSSIGNAAFSDCSSLTSIKWPESVSSIDAFVFSDCSSLTSIYLPESVSSIYFNTFRGCSNLTILCKEGSYAHQYAINYGIDYEIVENRPETPTEAPKYEITLTSEITSITSSEMQELVDINQTHDVVVNSTDGVTFTFPKGTMQMIEGKETYDLGVELITDYSQVTNSPFSEDEFAFCINYNYEGKLPSEKTSISIPVDKKWIGQRLYYYRISSDGTYTYLTSAVVDDNGIYTIIQGQCSDYIATLKAPEEQTETSAETDAGTQSDKDDSPKTGDTDTGLYIALCIAGLAGIFAAGCKKTAR